MTGATRIYDVLRLCACHRARVTRGAGRGNEIYEAANFMGKIAARACRNIEALCVGAALVSGPAHSHVGHHDEMLSEHKLPVSVYRLKWACISSWPCSARI